MPTLVLLVVKSVVLLGGALVFASIMRNRSAAARHLVWSIALTSALVLPALSLAAPNWNVLPVTRAGVSRVARAASPGWARSLVRSASRVVPSARTLRDFTLPAAHGGAAPAGAIRRLPTVAGTVAAPATVARAAMRSAVRRWRRVFSARPLLPRLSLSELALLLWACGAVLLVLRATIAMAAVSRLVRRAVRVDAHPTARHVLADAATRCAMMDAELRVSDEVDVPMTWGLAAPVVVLPSEALEWPSERRQFVLEHELAHVVRRDVWLHLIARVARAIYWINPLAWYADRELRFESEQACDDMVLARGARPTRYAEELLDIAGSLGSARVTSLAPGFASRSRIERRVEALLDPNVRRRTASRLDAVVATLGALVLALPLAAMRPYRASWSQPHRVVAIPVRPASMQTCLPDGGSSSNMTTDTGGVRRWEVHWTGDNCSVDLRAQGKVDFTDDFGDVRAIAPGGWLEVLVHEGGKLTRLYVKPNNDGSLDRRYTVDDQARPWDAAARHWLGGFLVDLDRQTAFAVDVRLPRLLAQGGPAAVLDEVGHFTGDYARSTYLQRLLTAAPLDHGDVLRVIDLVGSRMHSDYEIAQILVAVASKYGLPDVQTRADFLHAVDLISSDYERNRTLHALLDRSQPTEAEAGAILASASKLRSDYELARTLIDLVQRRLVTPALVDAYLADAARIKSDYERSRSLQALVSSQTTRLTGAELDKVIGTAATIESDYEKASVLVTVAGGYVLQGDARARYERAADTIHSDYERSRALGALKREAGR